MAKSEKSDEATGTAGEKPALKLLGRDAFLNAPPLRREQIEIPEMGGPVLVWEMTATEKGAYENACMVEHDGKRTFSLAEVRANLCVRALKDENGVRLFKDNEAGLLGRIGASIIDRIFPVASRLSDLSPKDIKELAGELKNSPSADT